MEESYNSLISQGIDELNADESSDDTGGREEASSRKRNWKYFHSKRFVLLLFFTVLSAGWWTANHTVVAKREGISIEKIQPKIQEDLKIVSDADKDKLGTYFLEQTVDVESPPNPAMVKLLHAKTIRQH